MPLQIQSTSVGRESSRYVKAAEADSVPLGDSVAVKLEGYFIGIHNVDGEYYAIDNVCPHVGGVLHAGKQEGGVIVCPIHEWKFDVKTGKCIWPGECELATFPLKVRGGDILVDLDSPSIPPQQNRFHACVTDTVERSESIRWRARS
ncbi:MAG: Rieske (2Fe-2S) protein [Candidatus Poribacteria bacterium]|nr:Rieske (2Fe-2S) protein [Candidatus Poribacteria bacterium]